jgi:site-specific recombinase XerD
VDSQADMLTRQDVEALLRVCSRRAPIGVRNRALIVLLWRCGLRISEALDLRGDSWGTRGPAPKSALRS